MPDTIAPNAFRPIRINGLFTIRRNSTAKVLALPECVPMFAQVEAGV